MNGLISQQFMLMQILISPLVNQISIANSMRLIYVRSIASKHCLIFIIYNNCKILSLYKLQKLNIKNNKNW